MVYNLSDTATGSKPMTTITITDPALLKQLTDARGPVMLRDPAGNVLLTGGELFGVPPEGTVPPISEAELKRRSETYRSGIPLAEVMKRLRGEL